MNSFLRLIAISFTTLIFCFTLNTSMEGQIEKTIHKRFGTNQDIRGIESYFIETNIRDTVRAGFYEAVAFRQLENTSTIEKSTLKGNYKENLKSGLWLYSNEKYVANIDSLSGLKIHAHLNGERHHMRQYYSAGKPDSAWIYKKDIIQSDTIEKAAIEATANWRLRTFQFTDKHTERHKMATGSFTEDGFLDGEWQIVYDLNGVLLEEKRQYVNGYLIKYSLTEKATGFILEDETFVEVISLVESGKDTTLFENHTSISEVINPSQLHTINLSTSEDMDFQQADELIKETIRMFFSPRFLGKEKIPIHNSQYGKTRAFRNEWNENFMDYVNDLQENKIPALAKKLQELQSDKTINQHVNEMPEIRSYLQDLNLALEMADYFKENLQYTLSTEYGFKSIRPVFRKFDWFRFKPLFDQVDKSPNGAKVFKDLSTKSIPDQIKTIYNQFEQIDKLQSNKAASLKKNIEQQKSLSVLIQEIYQTKAEIQDGEFGQINTTETSGLNTNIPAFHPDRFNTVMADALKVRFGTQQMNHMFEELEAVENMQTKQVIARSIKEFQIEILEIQQKEVTAITNILQNIDKAYQNPKGKRVNKILYESGSEVYNNYLDRLNLEQDYSNFKSTYADLNTFVKKIMVLGTNDPKVIKELEKKIKQETNLSLIESTIINQ